MASVQASKYLPWAMGLSGVLQLAGFVSPGWTRNKDGYFYSSSDTGLWYSVKCIETCEIESVYKGYDADEYHPYRPWQIQTTFALLAVLIGFICFIKARNTSDVRVLTQWLTNGVYCSLLSGILSLVPAGTVADMLRASKAENPFPYSLLLTGLGGGLALIISLISLYSVQSRQATNESGLNLSSL